MTRNTARINIAVTAAVVILISACSIDNFGRLRNSEDVGRSFAALQVPSNYRYWYLYLENTPYAVVGLDREYRIEDFSWTEVKAGSEVFRKVVKLVEGFPVSGYTTYGAYILNSKGERIGVWYSSLVAGITIDPNTKVVSITTRRPWIEGPGNDNWDD